jgi:hypothetical protein
LVAAFERSVDILNESGAEYAVIGGLARAAWGRVRATTDIDFAIVADTSALASVKHAFEQNGFAVRDVVAGEAPDTRPDIFTATSPDRVQIDFLVAKTPFEREAVARRERIELLGRTTYVVSVEDLVFYKLLAARPRDWDDMLDVLKTQTDAGRIIDWDRLERLAADWQLEEDLARLRSDLDDPADTGGSDA